MQNLISISEERTQTNRVESLISAALSPRTTPILIDKSVPRVAWKLESLAPMGHWTDRFVDTSIAAAIATRTGFVLNSSVEVVLSKLDHFALSLVQRVGPTGAKVVIFNDAPKGDHLASRLRELATHMGARVKSVRKGPSAAEQAKAYIEGDAQHRLSVSLILDLDELVQELGGQCDAPVSAVVLPANEGVVRFRGDCEVVVAQPGSWEGTKAERASMGHAGVLVSPDGASTIQTARTIAESVSGDGYVIAILPDGGQRHLGWYPSE